MPSQSAHAHVAGAGGPPGAGVTAWVLVVNSGSSSLKYQLVDVDASARATGGIVERIGEAGSGVPDHAGAVDRMVEALAAAGHDPREEEGAVTAIGHRVVHGGERFIEPTLIDDGVVAAIRELVPLAPLHNPGNLAGIEALRRLQPDVPHVAVFDTAFHRTLPAHAATYAVPLTLARKYGVRRYGFHGTSYSWVSRRAADLLGRPIEDLALIVLHLGNGASAAAVLGGRSVDTSMGLSPLEGLVMGTRSGDLDPALVFHLHRVADMPYDDIDALLTKGAGLKGMCGDNDLRQVVQRAESGDADARLALDVYCYRIRKYVGAYYAAMGRLDAVVFTAGVGENSTVVRARALSGLSHLGIEVDPARNEAPSRDARHISAPGATVAVLVVPTDEEMEIARQALAVASWQGGRSQHRLGQR
jgi:acetate kinase